MKKVKVKEIRLTFENCEGATLLPHMFGVLGIEEITNSRYINHFQYKDGEDSPTFRCKSFYLNINRKGDIPMHDSFDEQTLWERIIKYPDITSVHLYFTDGEEEHIAVPWIRDGWNNPLQSSEILSDELHIKIIK